MASNLGQTTAEADARLIQALGEPTVAGFKLIRGWPWLAANAGTGGTVHSLIVALNAVASYTDPKADGAPYTGTFANSGVKGVEESEQGESDRGAAIVQELTKVTTATSTATLGTAQIVQGDEVQSLFTVATGQADNIVLRYKYLNTSSRAYCMGEAAANLVALVASGDYPAWVTSTAYVVGNRVISSSTRYICLTAHTSGTFSTDLAAAKWLALDAWSYADRKFSVESDNTGTFSVLLQREKWQTGTTTQDAVVSIEPSLGSQKARIQRIWYRRTTAAKDTLITATTGAARIAYTFEGTSYTHEGVRCDEGSYGEWTITQTLVIPRNSISWQDTEGGYVDQNYEDWVITAWSPGGDPTWALKTITVTVSIHGTAADAWTAAQTSTLHFWDTRPECNGVQMHKGRTKYLGNNKWAAYIYTTSAAAGGV
mgnify:CR=1 FL=1